MANTTGAFTDPDGRPIRIRSTSRFRGVAGRRRLRAVVAAGLAAGAVASLGIVAVVHALPSDGVPASASASASGGSVAVLPRASPPPVSSRSADALPSAFESVRPSPVPPGVAAPPSHDDASVRVPAVVPAVPPAPVRSTLRADRGPVPDGTVPSDVTVGSPFAIHDVPAAPAVPAERPSRVPARPSTPSAATPSVHVREVARPPSAVPDVVAHVRARRRFARSVPTAPARSSPPSLRGGPRDLGVLPQSVVASSRSASRGASRVSETPAAAERSVPTLPDVLKPH